MAYGAKSTVPPQTRTHIGIPVSLVVLILIASLAGVAIHPPGAVGAATSMAPGPFLETFDGSPSAPLPWHPANWDVTVHSRDVGTFAQLETTHAGHGADCSAPPATHDISSYADAVFLCRDHVMTAIKAEGYGVIYLTPDHLVDFSSGEAVVSFDVSTLRTSDRDWIDVWITPFDDNVQLVGDIGPVDLNGAPRNGVQIRMDATNGATNFRGFVVRNFDETLVGSNDGLGLESLVTPSATVRTTFQLRLSRTHVKFGLPGLDKWWVDSDIADLGWSRGVLQLGHHSYNPEKAAGCGPPPEVTACTANTWHWDNVWISSALPFTMLQADRPRAERSTPTMTFGSAPPGAHLRFTGIGTDLAISFDGGRTWQAPELQAYSQSGGDEHFRSYWTPVPVGTGTVTFRGTDWFAGPWLVRNATIWAPSDQTPAPAPPATPGPASAPPVMPGSASPSPGPVTAPPPAPPPGSGGPPPAAFPQAAGFHSSWIDGSPYPTLLPGATSTLSLRFRNTGTEPWQTGVAGRQINLAAAGDSFIYAGLGMAAGWLSPNRLATTQETVVEPGQIGTFRFAVRAPVGPGSYRLDLRLVDDGVTWLDDQGVYFIIGSDFGFHSTWLSQTPWPSVRAGDVTTVSVAFTNTGSRPWVSGAPGQEAHLGVVGDDLSWAPWSVGWLAPDRPAAQSESTVLPAASGTFRFALRAPQGPGVYDLHLRLVVDGVTWLEDQGVFVRVTVLP